MWSWVAHDARPRSQNQVEGDEVTSRTGVGRVRLLVDRDRDRAGLDPAPLEVVEYRKSGLRLNWIIGRPLDCDYCVQHLFGAMKVPRALTKDHAAFELLVGRRFFQPILTPIQLLNRATDPMLPPVKPPQLLNPPSRRRLRSHAHPSIEAPFLTEGQLD
jgi:hypothetical protein